MATNSPTNWQALADASDSSWNRGSADGAIDKMVMADLPATAEYILQVNLYYRARRLSGDTVIAPRWEVAAIDIQGDYVSLTTNFALYSLLDVSCPDGGIWTPTKVNQLIAGYTIATIDTPGIIDISALSADVWYSYTAADIPPPVTSTSEGHGGGYGRRKKLNLVQYRDVTEYSTGEVVHGEWQFKVIPG